MLDKEILKDLLHQISLGRKDKMFLILAVDKNKPKSISEIKEIAKSAGLSKAQKWNISDILSQAKGAIRTKKGWELNSQGVGYLQKIGVLDATRPTLRVASDLRKHLTQIRNSDTRRFVEEAIKCFEYKLYRAAVVLSWVGAISLLYDHVISHQLSNFNAEAKRRDPSWRDARISDDLTRMTEYEFLNILASISVIGKSVKQELQRRLSFRNGCGHPSSLKIGEQMVAAHIESLILNVFSSF